MRPFFRRTELPIEALITEFQKKQAFPCFWLNEIGVTAILGSAEAERAEGFLRNLLQTSRDEVEQGTSYCYLKTLPIPLPETKDFLDEFENDPSNFALIEKAKKKMKEK